MTVWLQRVPSLRPSRRKQLMCHDLGQRGTGVDTATTVAAATTIGSSSKTGSSHGSTSIGRFKQNGGTRLSLGCHMGAASLFAVLSVSLCGTYDELDSFFLKKPWVV
ncbi:hypothetical protein DFH07DRAFT_772828 [Mycena maculata]|uniref:Uncharacterized protein n=1 Tax=Mycena maculata TaxID=230809 RepID=A0AAD7J536_9AGAR|nr:hypothetical protein DFH07DRAFT_772828 [Mycena maculata]